jgi:S1-C subfamily serine protease
MRTELIAEVGRLAAGADRVELSSPLLTEFSKALLLKQKPEFLALNEKRLAAREIAAPNAGSFHIESYQPEVMEEYIARREQVPSKSLGNDIVNTHVRVGSEFDRIFGSNKDAVVRIRSGNALGSGFLLDGGLVATADHVVATTETSPYHSTIYLSDGSTLGARLVARGVHEDLALLSIYNPSNQLPFIKLGSTSSLRRGQNAYTFGHPEGVPESVLSFGIVDGGKLEKSTVNEARLPSMFEPSLAERKIALWRFSLPVSHGNSGGAILNSKGESIGVLTLQDFGLSKGTAVDHLSAMLGGLKGELPSFGWVEMATKGFLAGTGKSQRLAVQLLDAKPMSL